MDIFDRQTTLAPKTMAGVAERRFADAKALLNTKKNRHANGVAYLAGFVIEILLKARLVQRYPAIARKRQHEVKPQEQKVWRLIWRQHDLEAMLDNLPEIEPALIGWDRANHRNELSKLKKICSTWTIFARYSPATINRGDAERLLKMVESLKEHLK